MIWLALAVACASLLIAALAHREATRSSSRKLARTVTEALEDLETLQSKLKREWIEERDRLGKQARRTGATLRRLDEVLDGSIEGAEGDESEDASSLDVGARGARGVPAMRPNLAQIPWRGGRAG